MKNFNAQDILFMKEALKQAEKAYDNGEVPVGAVLVSEGKIVAKGFNQVELLKDATAHAEMICLTAGTLFFNNWRLLNATLYSTLEPCSMCAGAMFSSRIKRLVWSAKDLRLGANGSFVDLFSKKHPFHAIEVEAGLLSEESESLMKSFFKKQRDVVF